MRYLPFFLFLYLLATIAYAGSNDKWVYTGPAEQQLSQQSQTGSQFDGIALILAIGAFVWAYLIYRDHKNGKKSRRR